MNPFETDLLFRYVNDALADGELEQVETLLREDREARDHLREIALHAVVIGTLPATTLPATTDKLSASGQHHNADDASEKQRDPSQVIGQRNDNRLGGQRIRAGTLVAGIVAGGIAVAGLIVTLFAIASPDRSEALRIGDLHGDVSWIGGDGQVTSRFEEGESWRGGTVELHSADACVELEFSDGSRLTLAGHGALTVSGKSPKLVHLHHGSLSANVNRQRKPMIVKTDAAELRVLGTQFNVDAQQTATRLAVNQGLVRLVRAVDGQELDVPANHQTIALLDDREVLALEARPKSSLTWISNLQLDVVTGKWVSQLASYGYELKRQVADGTIDVVAARQAYQRAAKLDDDGGRLWALPGKFGSLVWLQPKSTGNGWVELGEKSRFRIRGRILTAAGECDFGFTTRRPGGGFLAKYSVSMNAADLARDGEEFELVVPLQDFLEKTDTHKSPVGMELSDWWCFSSRPTMKIAVSHVELFDATDQD